MVMFFFDVLMFRLEVIVVRVRLALLLALLENENFVPNELGCHVLEFAF